VGIAKVVLDAAQLLGGPTRAVGEVSAPLSLIAEDGSVLFAAGEARTGAVAEEWAGALAAGAAPGWRRMRSGDIQALAPIRLPLRIASFDVEMPAWTLALTAPASAVKAPIMRLGAVLLACGMVVIAGIFIGGLALVEREVVGRIRRIGRAARRVADGDLSHRAPPGRPLLPFLGHDELDDLTDGFNEMVSRLERSYRALEAADELKTNFIRVAGHELRTPVSYIIGIGALLKDSRDPERLAEALQNTSAKGRRLEEIIRAMFKLMPEEAAPAPLRRERVDLRQVADIVAGQARVAIERRGVRLSIEVDPDLPEIDADRPKVRDMIENLVMNAIRFTAKGGQVFVRLCRAGDGRVRIEVENEGAQVPEEDVEHLFEPFYCAKDVMTHSTGEGYRQRGMGLGLAIVSHFAHLHGGEATMRPGERGPLFEIILPVAAGEPVTRPAK
jgi:signal transduction histidine kinase